MRRVVNSSEVYHLWAHQAQDEARSGNGNVSFRAENAFSYGTIIGRKVTAPNGERVYLLNSATFSSTTRQHQSMLRRSIPHGASVFECEYALRGYGFGGLTREDFLRLMLLPIPELVGKAKRARKYRELHERTIASIISKAREFSRVFNLPTDDLPEDPTELVEVLTELERGRQEVLRVEREERERREAERVREMIARTMEEDLPAWLRGERTRSLAWLPYSYLRVEGEEVVTSKGARVPLAHVQRIAPIVLRLIERGETYVRNGHTIHLGHYSLDRITEEGTVFAGCHTFEKSEILRFAEILKSLPVVEEKELAHNS
jgi:hypothetical protein